MLFEGGNPSLIPIEISPFILCFYVFKVYIYTPTPSTGFFGGSFKNHPVCLSTLLVIEIFLKE